MNLKLSFSNLRDFAAILSIVLAIALAFIWGRGYESEYVEGLMSRNIVLEQYKLRVEQIIQQGDLSVEAKQKLASYLGYQLTVPEQPTLSTDPSGDTKQD